MTGFDHIFRKVEKEISPDLLKMIKEGFDKGEVQVKTRPKPNGRFGCGALHATTENLCCRKDDDTARLWSEAWGNGGVAYFVQHKTEAGVMFAVYWLDELE